jgi:hypothetical protein
MASLAEISGVLSQHPGVEQVCTTIVHRDGQELRTPVLDLRAVLAQHVVAGEPPSRRCAWTTWLRRRRRSRRGRSNPVNWGTRSSVPSTRRAPG